MDYEFRIKLAETELAHLREMHALTRLHLDGHDRSIEEIASRTGRIEANLEKLTEAQLVTEVQMQALQIGLKSLIDAIAREHRNGH